MPFTTNDWRTYLVVAFQLINVGLVGGDSLVKGSQLVELVFQRTPHGHADGSHSVQLVLNPLAHDVGLGSKLPPKALIVLLAHHLLGKDLVAVWHQCLDLTPLVGNVLSHTQTSNSEATPQC